MSKELTEHDKLAFRVTKILVTLNDGESLDPQMQAKVSKVHHRTIRRGLHTRFANINGLQGVFSNLAGAVIRDVVGGNARSSLLLKDNHHEDLRGKEGETSLSKPFAPTSTLRLITKTRKTKKLNRYCFGALVQEVNTARIKKNMTNKKKTVKTYMPSNRNDLLNIFAEVGLQFETVSDEISGREKLITNGLKQLRKRVADDPWKNSELKKSHEFKTKTNKHLKKIRRLIETWVDDAENYDKRTEFRSRFADSLLVFVFGKVKAGKSSLGNFLAYGHSKPNLAIIEEASPAPNFFWAVGNGSTEVMSSDAMQQKRCFGVGTAETTSSIQGFTLPGITWVDSPGVHSTKAENEELTKKYSEAADVIVFLSNSSEPGRRSDMEEVRKLLGQDKPLLVIITASDSLETDIDNDGKVVKLLCMKSADDRQGQVDFVSQEIKSFGINTQVLTISLRYAESGEPNESKVQALERWRDSGMQDLAKELATLSASQGVTVKRTAPLRNLKFFCQTLIGAPTSEQSSLKADELSSIDALNMSLKKILQLLGEERTAIQEECRNVLPKIRASLTKKIKKLADQHVMDDSAFRKACMGAFSETCARYELEIGEQFISPFDGFDLRSIMPSPNFPNFKQRFESRTYTSKKAENVGNAVGAGIGGWGGAEAGMALGAFAGPVGAFVGGIIGGGLGLYLGKKAGGAVGENFNKAETFQTQVGDNREEVAEAVRKVLIEASERYLVEISRGLDQLCFENLEDWIKKLQTSINSFRRKLEAQINEINEELTHGIA